MEFKIHKTSGYFDREHPPVEGAVWKTYTRIDERVVDDPAKLNWSPDREGWYEKGTNHRVENGHIKRDFPHDAGGWFIEIEDVYKFMLSVNCAIVVDCDNGIPSIEIYDDYRE